MTSWDATYVGHAHKVLYEVAKEQSQENTVTYARYLAIVQSSGMGKSRTVDELSKEHLLIPINLRMTGTGKYISVLSPQTICRYQRIC